MAARHSSELSEPTRARRPSRVRMTSAERREQLISVARALFAARGFDGTSVEEIAAQAQVSKPVVYEHFGGKEGLYAVVVDREVRTLLDGIRGSLTSGRQRELIEQAALALLDYIEQNSDGFRILSRDSVAGHGGPSFATILSDVASQVEGILVTEFRRRRLDPKTAPLYAQALVGMVASTGQWWLDSRRPKKSDVAAHLVNLAWNGLDNLEARPSLLTREPG
jgi:AcrR family transcriptional regulator